MFKKHTAILSLLFLVMPIAASAERIAADMVLTNGRIYTVDARQPFVEAVAIKDAKFLAVGSAREIQGSIGRQTRVIDLGGAFAMPGFIDAHIHPAQPYLQEEGGALLFPESFDQAQIAAAVAAYLTENPDKPYIVGEKWSVGLFPNGRAHARRITFMLMKNHSVLARRRLRGDLKRVRRGAEPVQAYVTVRLAVHISIPV